MKNNFKLEPKWEKSIDQIWMERFEHLEERGVKINRKITGSFYIKFAAAAVIVAGLIFSFSFQRILETNSGNTLTYILPDGSECNIYENSKISYNPLIWLIKKEVKSYGSVLFTVKKGSQFKVSTLNGEVKVLGTIFRVDSYKESFEVKCFSGLVEVKSNKSESVDSKPILLNKSEGVKYTDSEIKLVSIMKLDTINNQWIDSSFKFTDTPLSNVLEIIARHYNCKIHYNNFNDYFYTGNFSTNNSIEEVLNIVCSPFEIKVEKSNDEFLLLN